MATNLGREIQIDGVTGNPIGGLKTGVTQNSYAVGSSGVGSSGVGLGSGSGAYGYQTSTQYVQQPSSTTTYSAGYQQPVGYTTGATYSTGPAYTTAGYGTAYGTGYGATTTGYGATTGYTTTTTTAVARQPQIVNTVVNTGKEVIKGESRIEYVPFEKKIVEYRE